MKGLVAKVALEGATMGFDKLYSYAIPPELHKAAVSGKRVTVPFGKGNTTRRGMVFEVLEEELKGLKSITSFTDSEPVLNGEMLKLCQFMSETVFCTYYDAVSAMLPRGLGFKTVYYYSLNPEFSAFETLNETEREITEFLKIKGEKTEEAIREVFGTQKEVLENLYLKEALLRQSDLKRKVGDATQKWVRLKAETEGVKFTTRQQEVVSLLEDIGSAAVKEICYFTGVSAGVIETLIKKGVLEAFEKQVFRTPHKLKAVTSVPEIKLTSEQQAAFSGLYSDYKEGSGKTALLYGITGSGKTSVYLKLVDEVIKENRGVMVMVPEISLTPQLINLFENRYGNKIAVFHSAMSMGQRLDEWRRIKNGQALIAIGTRSAVFAPFSNLGLIIIDEEQEHTYKSEQSPRFHARDLAKFRARQNAALLVLASATPSVESYTLAKAGKYSLYKIAHRFGNAVLPQVTTVDMREEMRNGNTGALSNELFNGVSEALENKKQVILLLNRRGHNTYVSCPSCSYVETCPNCSVSLTYHSANGRLMCHYCGFSKPKPDLCPECGSGKMKFVGLGTQKAEEELKTLFPDARILRLDADSTLARNSYNTYLKDFADGKYDILLGTQMVAKGLDFPNVTLVGVLGADGAMYSEDFRGFERSFSLLTQVVGRAGRGENEGRAIIQTVNPESNLIELAKNQDYDSFYEDEISTRKLMIYPPYCDICVVSAASMEKSMAEGIIKEIFGNITNLINTEFSGVKVIILGPSPAAVPKVNGKYRFRMIIKCKNNSEFRKMLKKATAVKLYRDAYVSVDMNPETVL